MSALRHGRLRGNGIVEMDMALMPEESFQGKNSVKIT